MRSKTRSAPAVGQQALPVTPRIMAASDEAPHRHAGRLAGLHAAHAILDHEHVARRDPHASRRMPEEIGRRLASPTIWVLDILPAKGAASPVSSRENSTRSRSLDEATQKGTSRPRRSFATPGSASRHRRRIGERDLAAHGRQIPRHPASPRAIIIRDCPHASAEKSLKNNVEIDLDPMASQHIHQAPAAEHLAVDQHAVAIEDDQLVARHDRSQGGARFSRRVRGPARRSRFHRHRHVAMRSYARPVSNSSTYHPAGLKVIRRAPDRAQHAIELPYGKRPSQMEQRVLTCRVHKRTFSSRATTAARFASLSLSRISAGASGWPAIQPRFEVQGAPNRVRRAQRRSRSDDAPSACRRPW